MLNRVVPDLCIDRYTQMMMSTGSGEIPEEVYLQKQNAWLGANVW